MGLTVNNLWGIFSPLPSIRKSLWIGGIIFVALAPDLDFLPGLWLGDAGRYHQTYSHSLGLGLLFSLLFGGIVKWLFRSTSYLPCCLLIFGVYGSHLLLDFFTADYSPPYGFPVWWPLSATPQTSPLALFPHVRRNLYQTDFWSHNLFALLVEGFILLPLWFASWKGRQIITK